MSSSEMCSRCLTRARSELPWATTSGRQPGPQLGDDRVVPVREDPGDHVGQALGGREDVGRQQAVAPVVAGVLGAVEVDRGRGHVVASGARAWSGRRRAARWSPSCRGPAARRSGARSAATSAAPGARAGRARRGRGWRSRRRGSGPRCGGRRTRGPPRAASRPRRPPRSRPTSLRGTSCQPVNRLRRFHVLSPWRRITRVAMAPDGRPWPVGRRWPYGPRHAHLRPLPPLRRAHRRAAGDGRRAPRPAAGRVHRPLARGPRPLAGDGHRPSDRSARRQAGAVGRRQHPRHRGDRQRGRAPPAPPPGHGLRRRRDRDPRPADAHVLRRAPGEPGRRRAAPSPTARACLRSSVRPLAVAATATVPPGLRRGRRRRRRPDPHDAHPRPERRVATRIPTSPAC